MTKNQDSDWNADLSRITSSKPFFKEQSLWAIWVYRFGRRIDQKPNGLIKKIMTRYYWFIFRIIETATGISIPKDAIIGPGIRIWHFGGVFIHPLAVIGKNCTLRQGVTIGNRHNTSDCPVIGDDVEIGAYAQILGAVRIGDSCKIGAMTVILTDMPDGSTAVGQPGRIIKTKSESLEN